jgi:hypothetical protein
MSPDAIRARALATLATAPWLDPVQLAELCALPVGAIIAALDGDPEGRFSRTAGPAGSPHWHWRLDGTAAGRKARRRMMPLGVG